MDLRVKSRTATRNEFQSNPLLRTDQNGWIEITTDGSQMWV